MNNEQLDAAIAAANLSPDMASAFRLNVEVEQVLNTLRTAITGPLKSRELSLAITNIEQGSHWLTTLVNRLNEGGSDG